MFHRKQLKETKNSLVREQMANFAAAAGTIDFVDIGLHTLIGCAFAFACGGISNLGCRYRGWLGNVLTIGGALGLGFGVLFWMTRELDQHDHTFGGLQSMLEWVVPGIAMALVYLVVLAVGDEDFD
jgi:hypothetical protein